MQAVHDYIRDVNRLYTGGKATEHSYRPALQALVEAILTNAYTFTNEPRRQACGAPDFILEQKGIPVGYMEAKDIGRLTDLTKTEKDQFERYTHSLDNLVYTDYLEFRFFRKGQKVSTVVLGKVEGGKVVLLPEAIDAFVNNIREFAVYQTQTIKSAKVLAEMMAHKARLVKDVFTNILRGEERSSLHDQYDAFKQVLVHDVSLEDFADIYAETLAYGLFTARLHDTTLETFSRGEAYSLIPRSNPFLRELFAYVGTKLDERAEWIVDALCDVFRATDVQKMLGSFNRGTGRTDPFLHFYETFLGEYNPEKKKARGVWYTPEAVVSFIVRSVDDVLQRQFGLPDGLADKSMTTIQVAQQTADKRHKGGTVMVDKTVHRVQVLDVATGTGTFLAEVIAQIHAKYKAQQGMWSSYVEEHLIPRLHGFELLMASYAMCHMKLELLLRETGYQPKTKTPPRLNVYLTNSLQKPDEEVDKLPLIEWFSRESNEASYIKKNTPIMVAIGNPPYSGISSNMGELIVDIEDYKYVNGVHFGERKHWLHDDYVKFLRLGEHFVAKNGEGVLGYITNHSWLDNPTFRGMRWHMLTTFDALYVLDLHGNAKKKEVCPDGSPDKNVFDIQQGVAIVVGVKTRSTTPKAKPLAEVYHAEVWGSRDAKYAFLEGHSLKTVTWQKLEVVEPFYFFVPKNMEGEAEYQQGFGVQELFPVNVTGIVTMGDGFIVANDKATLKARLEKFLEGDVTEAQLKSEYGLGKNYAKWILGNRATLKLDEKKFVKLAYRPFDTQWTYFDNKLVWRWRENVMRHFLDGENVGLITVRQVAETAFNHVLSSRNIVDNRYTFSSKGIPFFFPLYLYDPLKGKEPNLDGTIWKKVQQTGGAGAADPQAVFDYVYAVLHAPTYRQKYATFLKSDFPRIPYPASPTQFDALAKLGATLRQLHLLEHPACTPADGMASYPVDGPHTVDKPTYKDGRVYINPTQYFADVPEVAWNFYIGGYQPAQKWLKDRKGRALTFEDIQHYQRIIATLTETHRVMGEVDGVYRGE